MPHPASSAYPFNDEGYNAPEAWHFQGTNILAPPPPAEFYDHHFNQHMRITPSMSSLEALLSKLPSVVPPAASVCHQLRGGSVTVFILRQVDGTDGRHDRGGKGRD